MGGYADFEATLTLPTDGALDDTFPAVASPEASRALAQLENTEEIVVQQQWITGGLLTAVFAHAEMRDDMPHGIRSLLQGNFERIGAHAVAHGFTVEYEDDDGPEVWAFGPTAQARSKALVEHGIKNASEALESALDRAGYGGSATHDRVWSGIRNTVEAAVASAAQHTDAGVDGDPLQTDDKPPGVEPG